MHRSTGIVQKVYGVKPYWCSLYADYLPPSMKAQLQALSQIWGGEKVLKGEFLPLERHLRRSAESCRLRVSWIRSSLCRPFMWTSHMWQKMRAVIWVGACSASVSWVCDMGTYLLTPSCGIQPRRQQVWHHLWRGHHIRTFLERSDHQNR